MKTEGIGEGAFLDIATNLLAIILILTLFSLVSLQHQTQSAKRPDARPTSTQRFEEPLRERFPPFSAFYFVLHERVARWDQEAVVDALADDPGRRAGITPQGRFEWIPEPLVTRDIDTFQVRFYLDAEAIRRQEPPFGQTEIDAFIAALLNDYDSQRLAPVFIVHPEGMETFSTLYTRLRATDLRFRWFARAAEEPLLLGRHPAQFTDHGLYW